MMKEVWIYEPLNETDSTGQGMGVITIMRYVLEGSQWRVDNGILWVKWG